MTLSQRLIITFLTAGVLSMHAFAAGGRLAAAALTRNADVVHGMTSADERENAEKKKRKKDPITVRGCLHGTTLADVRAEEEMDGLTSSVSLRSSREIRKKLKEYDRHEVEVTGVLTPAPRSPLSGKWGGTTVSVGAADPRRPIGQQTPPPVASIEVDAVQSLAASCH